MPHRRFSSRPSLVVAFAFLLVILPTIAVAEPGLGLGAGKESIAAILSFGFLLGIKHALDADHLVAVSTIVSERRTAWSAALVGGMWGVGHTASLLIAGVIMILLRPQLPPLLAPILELAVAVMIIVLGISLLIRMVRHGGARVHAHAHSHGGITHWHPHIHLNNEPEPTISAAGHHWIRSGRKPFLVGMMHGLAGSASLVLLVLAELRSPVVGLIYLLIFGIGSIGGMLVMSALFTLPYVALQRRFGRLDTGLRLSASLFSILFGAYLVIAIIREQGLF
jgi:high-affinity nickel-transport protein